MLSFKEQPVLHYLHLRHGEILNEHRLNTDIACHPLELLFQDGSELLDHITIERASQSHTSSFISGVAGFVLRVSEQVSKIERRLV